MELLWKFEEQGRVALFRPIYARITGDVVSALLLSQIIYWFKPNPDGSTKLKVFFDGRYWIAKRRTDWQHEIGITDRQFDRSCDLLVSLGIVERTLTLFGKTPLIHLSLNVKRMSILLTKALQEEGNHDLTESVKSDFTKTAKTYSKKTVVEGDDVATAKETLAKLQAKQKFIPDVLPASSVKPTVLSGWWTKLVSHSHGTFCPPLTKKEEGALGHWIKKVGKENAYPVMRWAIGAWDEFVIEVGAGHGVTIGSKPSILPLVKYADVAVTEYRRSLEKAPVQLTAKKPKVTKFIVE